jgi:hypothetical protein
MASDNILDAVERIETAVFRFERILYGDPPAHPHGLLVQVEGMRNDMNATQERVLRLERKRPNLWLWLLGFLTFLVSGCFAIVGFVNLALSSAIWDLSPWTAFALAVLFAVISCVLFMAGFGWLDGRA